MSHFFPRFRASGRRLLCAAACLIGTALLPVPTTAQEMLTSASLQLSFGLRVLEFDRSRTSLDGEEIVVGVLYQQRHRSSVLVLEELDMAVASLQKEGISIQIVPIPVDGDERVVDLINQTESLDLLYVAPLRAYSIESITALSRSTEVLTLTGVADYVEDGLSVGIVARSGRPEILINLPASKAEGADLGSELLKLSRIVNGPDLK